MKSHPIFFKKILVALIVLLSYSTITNAQTKDLGSWNSISLKGDLTEKWSLFSELQLRSLSFYDRFYYYEIKGGITYSIKKNFSVAFGTGFYNTFNEGVSYDGYDKKQELRIWEQLNYKHSFAPVQIDHRIRIEQQFTGKYSNRFRYRLNAIVPINNKKLDPQTLYAAAFDEIFLTDKDPHFARNRIHAGLGYVFNKTVSLQSGWIQQVDYKTDSERRKNYLLMNLIVNF